MRIVTKLVFIRENHVTQKIEEAFRTVGGQGWPEDDPRHKPFRLIRGNDATLEDIHSAVATIKMEAQKIKDRARTSPCPFPELEPGSSRVEDTWREGELRSADRAIARAEAFLEDVNALYAEALDKQDETGR